MINVTFVPLLLQGPNAAPAPSSGRPAFWLAALELAVWNLGSQGLLTAGVELTEATRASFLTQTSVVLTPIVARIGGERVAPMVWAACALALVGVVTLTAGPAAA